MSSSLRDYFIDFIINILNKVLFWEKDPKRIVNILSFTHNLITYIMFIFLIVIHTVIPSFFLLVLFYIIYFFIWLHQIITGGCIISKVEQKLIGDSNSFVDPILDAFHIPITSESTSGIIVMGSTLVMIMLSLELFARTILTVKSYLRF